MLGLALAKRRRYGGYIIHLGVAIMFLGFAGKAYEREDRHAFPKSLTQLLKDAGINENETTSPRAQALVPQATFEAGDYTFTYVGLIKTSTHHEDIVSAEITIARAGKKITTLYPSLHHYHRARERPAKSPAIAPPYLPTHLSEPRAGHIYLVL